MERVVTTLLDVLGLLLLAAGAYFLLALLAPGLGLLAAGLVVLAGSVLAEHLRVGRRGRT